MSFAPFQSSCLWTPLDPAPFLWSVMMILIDRIKGTLTLGGVSNILKLELQGYWLGGASLASTHLYLYSL